MRTDNLKQYVFLYGLGLLLLISPFYSQNNIGGSGLSVTYNIPVWMVASWIMATGLFWVQINKYVIYPKFIHYFTIFPIIIIISGSLADINSPLTWLFRQIYILGGLAFLLALFQFSAKQWVIDSILFFLVIATGLHALVGALQTVGMTGITTWFSNDGLVPRSNFQQINVHVSFLVTGLATSLYYISRPSFHQSKKLKQLAVITSFTLGMYVVIASGSRIGILTALISIPLVLWSRYYQLKQNKMLLAIMFVLACGGGFLGQSGIHRTLDKTVQLTDSSYSAARVSMYTIGLELVAKDPVRGYGIGGFLKAWNKQSSDFIARNPEAVLPNYVSHPHNEILFWMIEGGVLAVAGIAIVIAGILLALFHCGFQRGGAYAAMLLPISLHTQVELPFYISSLHWFLWLFIIYLVLRHQTKMIDVNFSQSAKRLIQFVTIVFACCATIFLINTARAQVDLRNFLYDKNAQPPFLQLALNNLYFRPVAEQLAMRSMLYASIESGDSKKVELFESWAEEYVYINPELKMYEDLISASVFLRPEEKGCDAIKEGLTMYAHNEALQQAYKEKCLMKN